MAVEQVFEQAFPFVVDGVAPARLKLWANFAGQLSSDADFYSAENVYSGFHSEYKACERYSYAVGWAEAAASGDKRAVSSMVGWLGLLVTGLGLALQEWATVERQFVSHGMSVSFPQHYKDATEAVSRLTHLRYEVRSFVIVVCEHFGLPLLSPLLEPENSSPCAITTGEDVESF